VILCDVSDSVRNASRFMLQFVYSLQDLYSRVRSFIFVADIGEVTECFRNNDAKERSTSRSRAISSMCMLTRISATRSATLSPTISGR